MSTGCSVRLEAFEGPLDLLYRLVREQRFDITTVPLAAVAEQYLAYVAAMEHLDVDAAAEYLVIAATLTFLKSRSLLPTLPSDLVEESDESPEVVEERLRTRLMTYSRYREIALALRERYDSATGFYMRPGGDASAEILQRYRLNHERLAAALQRLFTEARPERRNVVRERFSLIVQMELVLRYVLTNGASRFAVLVADYDRAGIIVTFLAVLELVRQGRLAVAQEEPTDLHLHPAPPTYEVASFSDN